MAGDSAAPLATDLPANRPPDDNGQKWLHTGLNGHWMLHGSLHSEQDIHQWPGTAGEIAFWGRSNVGKSTLLNALAGQRVARCGRTPGVTRALMIYGRVASKAFPHPPLWLIDLPGYGYAQVSMKQRAQMAGLVNHFLQNRRSLCELWLLIDAMIGMRSSDFHALSTTLKYGVPVRVVLTKCDRVAGNLIDGRSDEIGRQCQDHGVIVRSVESWGAKNSLGLQRLRYLLACQC